MFRRAVLTFALIAAVPARSAYARSCDTTFTVVNRSHTAVAEVYFRSSGNNSAGSDRLGQNVMANGASAQFRPSRTGGHDLRFAFTHGRSLERRQINLCAVSRVSTVTNTAQGIAVQ